MRNRVRVNNPERLPPFDERPFLLVQNPDNSLQNARNLAPDNYPLRLNTTRNLLNIYLDRTIDVENHRENDVQRLLLELRLVQARNDYQMAEDAMLRIRDLHHARVAERGRLGVNSTEVEEIPVPNPDTIRQIV